MGLPCRQQLQERACPVLGRLLVLGLQLADPAAVLSPPETARWFCSAACSDVSPMQGSLRPCWAGLLLCCGRCWVCPAKPHQLIW